MKDRPKRVPDVEVLMTTVVSVCQFGCDYTQDEFVAMAVKLGQYARNLEKYADQLEEAFAESETRFYETQWISVEDELPEFTLHDNSTTAHVIVHFENYVSTGYLYKQYAGRENVWFTNDDSHDLCEIHPTHWMPLPKPPKK